MVVLVILAFWVEISDIFYWKTRIQAVDTFVVGFEVGLVEDGFGHKMGNKDYFVEIYYILIVMFCL